MNDFKITLNKRQEHFLSMKLPKGYSFELYKVRKNINDYPYKEFDKKYKKGDSAILSKKQSIMIDSLEASEKSYRDKSEVQSMVREQLSPLQSDLLWLTRKLRKHESSYPFRSPVDPKALQIPDYFDVVLEPIDLKTIEQQIRMDKYEHLGQFERDIYKMVMNSYKFNQKSTSTYNKTIQFEEYFMATMMEWRKVKREGGGRGKDGGDDVKEEMVDQRGGMGQYMESDRRSDGGNIFGMRENNLVNNSSMNPLMYQPPATSPIYVHHQYYQPQHISTPIFPTPQTKPTFPTSTPKTPTQFHSNPQPPRHSKKQLPTKPHIPSSSASQIPKRQQSQHMTKKQHAYFDEEVSIEMVKREEDEKPKGLSELREYLENHGKVEHKQGVVGAGGDKEKIKQRERQKERQKEKEKEKERERQKQKEKEREKQKEREKERERQREKERERQAEKQKQKIKMQQKLEQQDEDQEDRIKDQMKSFMQDNETMKQQNFSEGYNQFTSGNKIRNNEVQKQITSLLKRLSEFPLTKQKKNKLFSKFANLQQNMTQSDKKKLFDKISKLDENDVEYVLRILTRGKSEGMLKQDQFEIDLDKADSKVLREIQNFIALRDNTFVCQVDNGFVPGSLVQSADLSNISKTIPKKLKKQEKKLQKKKLARKNSNDDSFSLNPPQVKKKKSQKPIKKLLKGEGVSDPNLEIHSLMNDEREQSSSYHPQPIHHSRSIAANSNSQLAQRQLQPQKNSNGQSQKPSSQQRKHKQPTKQSTRFDPSQIFHNTPQQTRHQPPSHQQPLYHYEPRQIFDDIDQFLVSSKNFPGEPDSEPEHGPFTSSRHRHQAPIDHLDFMYDHNFHMGHSGNKDYPEEEIQEFSMDQPRKQPNDEDHFF